MVDLEGAVELENNDSNDRNLYHSQLLGVNVDDIPQDNLKKAILGLPTPTAYQEEHWVTRRTLLKGDLLRKHIKHLQKQGIVIHTGKIHIDKDVMINWVDLVFEQDMGDVVEQVKVLSCYYFLVIVHSHE